MILMYFFGFCPLFIILSISVEGLFFVSYTLTLLTWVEAESIIRAEKRSDEREGLVKKDVDGTQTTDLQSQTYTFRLDDLRIALFFLFFVQVGFFGTGK